VSLISSNCRIGQLFFFAAIAKSFSCLNFIRIFGELKKIITCQAVKSFDYFHSNWLAFSVNYFDFDIQLFDQEHVGSTKENFRLNLAA